MVRLAIAANTAFALDDSDLAEDATGFTADLLPRLAARYPGAKNSTFIVGGDFRSCTRAGNASIRSSISSRRS